MIKKKEEELKNNFFTRYKDYFIIFIVLLVSRLCLYNYDPLKMFKGTFLNYFYETDCYYFLDILEHSFTKLSLFIMYFLLFFLTLIVLYKIMLLLDVKKSIALFSVLAFNLFPLIMEKTTIGNIDRHLIIMALLLLILYYYYKRLYMIMGCFIIILFLVSNTLIYIGVLILGFLFFYSNKWLKLLTIIPIILLIIKLYKYFFIKGDIVELGYNKYIFFYIILIPLLVYLIYKNIYKSYPILFNFFIIYLVAGIIFIRFSIFALLYGFIFIAICLNKVSKDKLFKLYLVLIIFTIPNLVLLPYNIHIFMERSFENPLSNLQCNKQYIANWGNGHAYQYFSNCTFIYKGESANQSNIRFNKAIEQPYMFDSLNTSKKYYLIIAIPEDNHNIDLNSYSNFTLLNITKGKYNTMYVLERKWLNLYMDYVVYL